MATSGTKGASTPFGPVDRRGDSPPRLAPRSPPMEIRGKELAPTTLILFSPFVSSRTEQSGEESAHSFAQHGRLPCVFGCFDTHACSAGVRGGAIWLHMVVQHAYLAVSDIAVSDATVARCDSEAEVGTVWLNTAVSNALLAGLAQRCSRIWLSDMLDWLS